MTAADGNDAVARLAAIFNRLGVAYMLVGSYSSNAYGIPRATGDADFVVETLCQNFDLINEELGADFQVEPQIEFELITGTIRRIIRFVPVNFTIELFELSDDAFDRSRFDRRVSVESSVLGGTVWLPAPEDVVVQKLRWGRPQDISDVENVITVQGDRLDWQYIQRWTDEHGSTGTLEQIRNEL